MTESLSPVDFPDTPWSMLARQQADGEAENLALQSLLELYWQPVFCAIRDGWMLEPDEAGTLCDKFLYELLRKKHDPVDGSAVRFRVFLKAELRRFMESSPSNTPPVQTSGIAIDTGIAAERSSADAEGVFDDRWLLVVFRQALQQTRLQLDKNPGAYELLVHVDVERKLTAKNSSEEATLRLAREMFRRELIELVYQSVGSFDEARDELRWLLT
ncbi:MAG: hypothetical protein AAF385_05135 [Pseudomonadota bacterium]